MGGVNEFSLTIYLLTYNINMDYLWFYLAVLLAWIFWTMAEVAEKGVEAVKSGNKDSGGVSVLPGILIMPIFAVLIALSLNMFWPPVGFWLVGFLHALGGMFALGYIVYALIYIKSHDT